MMTEREQRPKQVVIRPYQEKDRQAVREICIATSGLPTARERQRKLLLLQYCDYYLEQEPDACFVAADEADRPVGYILCAKDYPSYRKRFLAGYLPHIRALSVWRAIAARLDVALNGRYAERYPAHMHIDILDAYQRQGVGHRLVDALTSFLEERQTQGLMLSVGANNQKGVRFYEKYGFQRLGTVTGVIVIMGLWLQGRN